MLELEIAHRNELSKEDLVVMNSARDQAFPGCRVLNYGYLTESVELWFLMKNKNVIVSFGSLRAFTVCVLSEYFSIFAVKSITSVEKGKGYGSALMLAIKDYVLRHEVPAIGFCESPNAPFYVKAGWNIIKQGESRFIFQYGVDEFGSVTEDLGDALWMGDEKHPVIMHLVDENLERITAFRESW